MSDVLTILQGDALEMLRTLPDYSVQCCVTSPPYWGLRDYGVAGQLGLEKTPQEYVAKMVEVFREVRRVLRDDGTLWLNLGDSYARNGGAGDGGAGRELAHMAGKPRRMCKIPKAIGPPNRSLEQCGSFATSPDAPMGEPIGMCHTPRPELKPKDLVGIPWRVAFALQADGWYLRSDIIWAKRNCMPESVTDRPTRSHEYLFLLAKSERYYYDYEAINEPCSESFSNDSRWKTGSTDRNEKDGYADAKAQNPKSVHRLFDKQRGHSRRHAGFNDRWDASEAIGDAPLMRNKRDVWTVSPARFKEAHFATFPPDLIKPCIMAGSKPGDTVLDPFGGSGTTGMVALEFGRKAVLIELNPEYVRLIEQRTNVTPGLAIA